VITLRLSDLDSRHRHRLAEILAATGRFSDEEMNVALELFDETFGEGRGERGEGPDPPMTALPSPLSPPASDYEFLGAFDEDDTLVGYTCYGPTPGTDGTFDLYWIAVHPAAQGAGEGTRLLAEVERRLLERGGRLLIAETSSRGAYEPTRRFYHARGYREVARVAAYYAPADDRVIYAKRLSPKAVSADRPPPTYSAARSASP
jgi:ribosomal protein S18 acetylase RimI-like enzyme